MDCANVESGRIRWAWGLATGLAMGALTGCGGDAGPGMAETEGADTDGEGETAHGSSGGHEEGSTGGTAGDSVDGSSGGLDETATTGEDETGTTGGEIEESPYRIVFSDVAGGTIRLYSATPDFEQILGLSPVGLQSVHVKGSWTMPALHPNGRFVAFRRGDTLYAADV